jgi:O-methyltransferase domain/Dimerisation domain
VHRASSIFYPMYTCPAALTMQPNPTSKNGARKMTEPQAPAHVGILQMMGGLYVTGAISALAELGVPDLLENGPKSAEELAAEIGAKADPLYRLMRATSSVGVLAEGADGKFSQTPMSAVLCTNASPSLRGYARMSGRDWHLRGWAHLTHCIKTGGEAMSAIYGTPVFQYLKNNREEAEGFDEAMTGLSAIDGPAVADAYDFSDAHSIVDIAGGHGLLLATILERNPHMTGTLYDADYVVEGAKERALKSLAGRCTFASGDMFASVPTGTDVYIMKHIIHDWPDEACLKILKACRAGVNPGGKLLVVDCVVPTGNEFSPIKFFDLQMMIFPSGQERTEAEFRELLAAGGWRVSRVIPTAAMDSIVEALPG